MRLALQPPATTIINTVKVFMVVTPPGSISFISQACRGRVSDKEITQRCELLEKLHYGDLVMDDLGFGIADALALRGAYLLIPACTKGES